MGDLVKPRNSVHRYGHDLRKRRHIHIDVLGQLHQPPRRNLHILLQKAVHRRAAELGGAQIILADIIIGFRGTIGHHHHPIAGSEFAAGVSHNYAHALMDQRHRQLLGQHLGVPGAQIITHICVADGKIGGAHNGIVAKQVNVLKGDLKPAGRRQTVDGVNHGSRPPTGILPPADRKDT